MSNFFSFRNGKAQRFNVRRRVAAHPLLPVTRSLSILGNIDTSHQTHPYCMCRMDVYVTYTYMRHTRHIRNVQYVQTYKHAYAKR